MFLAQIPSESMGMQRKRHLGDVTCDGELETKRAKGSDADESRVPTTPKRLAPAAQDPFCVCSRVLSKKDLDKQLKEIKDKHFRCDMLLKEIIKLSVQLIDDRDVAVNAVNITNIPPEIKSFFGNGRMPSIRQYDYEQLRRKPTQ